MAANHPSQYLRIGLLLLVTVFCPQNRLWANPPENPSAICIKIQAYPAGIIPAANGVIAFSKADAFFAFAGYTWIFSDGRIALSATAALGAEINIKTEGEEVGEGAIFLLGIRLGYRF